MLRLLVAAIGKQRDLVGGELGVDFALIGDTRVTGAAGETRSAIAIENE